ncbi:MAG: large repetitive protein [Pseudonocardiales bacterium]|nr:large repetitive protein [Pseudonocardiales bacterium]
MSFDYAGTCVLDAKRAGNIDDTAAPQAQQTVTVNLTSATVTLALTPTATVYGPPGPATATTTSSVPRTGRFFLDGFDRGTPLRVATESATSPALGTLAPGGHQIGATVRPAVGTVFATSSAVPQTETVSKGRDHPATMRLTIALTDFIIEGAHGLPLGVACRSSGRTRCWLRRSVIPTGPLSSAGATG